MKKRVLVSLMTIGLAMHLTGCTSSDASKDQDDTAVAQDDSFQEEGSGDFDDGSKTAAAAPAEGNTDVAKTDDTGAAAGGDMAAPDAAGGSADAAAAPAAGGNDELALDGADPGKEFPDDVASKTTPPPADASAPGAAPTDQGLFDNPPAATADAGTPPPAPAEPPAPSADVAGAPPVDAGAGVVASQAAPDTTPTAGDLATNAGSGAGADAPKKSFAPLQRVKDAPFEEKGANLNRYYIARAGDTTKSVAQKIYGSDRSKDLKAWNATLKARSMKVGDKVYYNSPKDPQDTAKMMSFYEENGVAPQTYVTKDGDDLRDVSKKLLGSKDSWKEVWATNSNVESKGKVPAGVEVRYWGAGTEVAGASPSAPAPNGKNNVAANGDTAPGGDQGLSDVPPPPPNDMANNGNVPPPPPGGDMNGNQNGAPGAAAGAVGAAGAAGANGNVPPPPPGGDMNGGAPPAQAAAPPPPPPPPPAPPAQMNKKPAQVADSTTSDNDQTMMLGAGGLLVLGGVLAFSVLRRKKASKARIDMTQTQV